MFSESDGLRGGAELGMLLVLLAVGDVLVGGPDDVKREGQPLMLNDLAIAG